MDAETYEVLNGYTDDGTGLVCLTLRTEGHEDANLTLDPEAVRELAKLLTLAATEIECAGVA